MTPQEKRELRSVLGKFATGVTVVSFQREGECFGMTVNSFSSVSLEPPLVLFCPALDCRFSEGAELGSLFTISILSETQKDVCLHFAGRPCLDGSPWMREEEAPIVDGAIAQLRCQLVGLHLHGDHYVAVGEVVDKAVLSEDPPLLFYSGKYPKFDRNPK